MRRWAVTEETLKCCIKGCGRDAVHTWGKATLVPFCCKHFTDLIIEIFDIREAIFARVRQEAIGEFERRIKNIVEHHSHLDAVEEYEQRMKRKSQIEGTKCDGADDIPPEHRQ